MAEYKSKECSVCGKLFVPKSPKQKTCGPEHSKTLKRKRDRNLEFKNRERHSIKCLGCSLIFQTTDSKRKYCGSRKCERLRKRRNNLKSETSRVGDRVTEKKGYYEENKCKILNYKKKYYREVLFSDREVRDGWSTERLDIEKAKEAFEGRGYTLLAKKYINSSTKMPVRCPNGHLWYTSLHNFKDFNGSGCLYCYLESPSLSKPEQEIHDFVCRILHGNTTVLRNDRSVISPYELDIYVPSKNLAIEYCGLYWHSELNGKKDRQYHYSKMQKCFKKGVRLITIFEDEYLSKPDVVKSRIRHALGVPERRIFARKCEFKPLISKVCSDFLERYHLQGKSPCKYRFGLYYGGELVQVMTFGSLSRTHAKNSLKGTTIELKRFASLPGCFIIGGASKLFKNSVKTLKEQGAKNIKSYCDMRYGNIFCPVYESLGFYLQGCTKYTPHYILGQKRYRNQSLRKTEEERKTGKTEWELRREQGYDRIWDCGHRTYVYEI